MGYFRPAGVIDVKAGVDAERTDRRLGVRQLELRRRRGSARRTTSRTSGSSSTRRDSPLRQGSYRGLAATANHYAREMHMDAIARALGVDAVEFRLRHLKDERMRAVLTAAAQKIGWPKPSAAGPRARHRVRHREGQLRRDRRRGVARRRAGFKVERLVVVVRVRRDRQPRRPAEPGRRRGRPGPRRRAVRGDRVRRRRNCERHDGAVPRAAVQGRPADRVVLLDRKDICRRPARARRRSSAWRRRSAAPSARSARSRRRCPFRLA